MAAPKLRFKEFDGDWNKSTIGNFVLNYKGGASLTPADFVEYSDCEVIPKKAISSGGLLQLDKVVPTFCTLEFFNSNQNYIVDSEFAEQQTGVPIIGIRENSFNTQQENPIDVKKK